MRRLLFILLLCGSSWAQDQLPVPVQICPSSGATTCAFANNVVSGNVIIIGAHNFSGTLTTPTDTRSTTWTLLDSNTATNDKTYVWCGVLASGGAETITLTGSPSFEGIVASEWPAAVGCTKDVSANGTTSGSSVTTSSVTTTVNGDFLYTFVTGDGSGGLLSPVAPTLSIFSINGASSGADGYRFTGTNGSYNATFNIDTSGSYVIVALKPSAATMVTTSLPSGSLTNSYSYTPQCVGGVGAYTWTASSLPTGLSINSSTGAITGTPTGGTTTPTITCTGATSGAASLTTAPLTINSSAGTISVIGTPCSATVSGPTSCSLGTVTSGNCLVVTGAYGRANVALPTDSLGSTFRYIGAQYTTSQIQTQLLWVGVAVSTGADTVTLSSGTAITAVQVSNCQYGFFDVATSKGGTNAGSVTISGSSLTTLAPGSEILSSIMGGSAGTTWTAGTGFATTAGNSGSSPMQGISANESSTGTYTPAFVQTGNASGSWIVWGVALRPSTSGVVNTNHRRAWVISK